ncbi:hypothetical protein ACOSP7_027995 [Xanthoceras sorbifolium]
MRRGCFSLWNHGANSRRVKNCLILNLFVLHPVHLMINRVVLLSVYFVLLFALSPAVLSFEISTSFSFFSRSTPT